MKLLKSVDPLPLLSQGKNLVNFFKYHYQSYYLQGNKEYDDIAALGVQIVRKEWERLVRMALKKTV